MNTNNLTMSDLYRLQQEVDRKILIMFCAVVAASLIIIVIWRIYQKRTKR